MIRELLRIVRFRDPRSALPDLSARYAVERELGRGGMAVVYLARDRQLDRDVAIKIMQSTRSEDRTSVARLAHEARIVAQLHHPNIVAIHDLQPLRDGSVALVMQYVRGRTLRHLIDEEGKQAIAFVERVLQEVASALGAAHRRGIIHRDVKPENIYLEQETGRALLADFGIARSSRLEVGLTLDDEVLGTPQYMSPEQIVGGELDSRSDLYSLALVGYEMLTGQRPWAGESLYQILHKQQHEQLPPVRASRTDLPIALENALDQALRKERLDRPETAESFISLIRGEITVTPPRRGASRRIRATSPEALNEASANEPTVRYQRPGAVEQGDGSSSAPSSPAPASTEPAASAPSTAIPPDPTTPASDRSGSTSADFPQTTPPSSASGLPPISPFRTRKPFRSVPAAPDTNPVQTDAPGAEVDPLIGLSQRLRIQATEPSATDGGVKRTWPRIPKAAGVAAAFVVAAILVAAIGLRGGLPDANTQAASSPQAEGLAEQPAAAEPEPAAAAAPARMPAARGGGGSGGGRSSGRASDRYQASGDITDIFCQPREDETVEAWRARVPPYCQLTP